MRGTSLASASRRIKGISSTRSHLQPLSLLTQSTTSQHHNHHPSRRRLYCTPTTTSSPSPTPPATATLPPRWLSDLKLRIGVCLTFGLTSPVQHFEAAFLLRTLTLSWRDLVAGSEGFLTDPSTRCGLFRQQVVWGEMDSMGHVNNVQYNRYAESGRVGWLQKFARFQDPANGREWMGLLGNRGDGVILRGIKTEFKFPMKWPDHVTIYHKLRDEPTPQTDALVLDVLIMSEVHQRPAARCVEDIVVYDYRKGKKGPLKPFMLKAFQETWRLQEEAKRKNSARVNSLLERVRALEKATWDRPDAVEDMGSGSR